MKQPNFPLWLHKELSTSVTPVEYCWTEKRPKEKGRIEIHFDPVQQIFAVYLLTSSGHLERKHIFSCTPQEFMDISVEIGRLADAAVESADKLGVFEVKGWKERGEFVGYLEPKP